MESYLIIHECENENFITKRLQYKNFLPTLGSTSIVEHPAYFWSHLKGVQSEINVLTSKFIIQFTSYKSAANIANHIIDYILPIKILPQQKYIRVQTINHVNSKLISTKSVLTI